MSARASRRLAGSVGERDARRARRHADRVHAVLRARPACPTVGGTKNPDVAAIVALAPDLVVVNDEENRWRGRDRAHRRGSRRALDVAAVGARRRRRRCARWRSGSTRRCPSPFGADEWDAWLASVLTPRWYDAFVAVWRRPWMSLASDTYGSSLLDLLGVSNVFADSLRALPGGDARRRSRRGRRTSSCCRASPTSSGPSTPGRSSGRSPGVPDRRSSTAATCSGGGSAHPPPPPAWPRPCCVPEPHSVWVWDAAGLGPGSGGSLGRTLRQSWGQVWPGICPISPL